jgi:hypothetical protein
VSLGEKKFSAPRIGRAVRRVQRGAGFGEITAILGRGRRSEGFFRDAKMRMGMARGMVAENKLTCALEFPILSTTVLSGGFK